MAGGFGHVLYGVKKLGLDMLSRGSLLVISQSNLLLVHLPMHHLFLRYLSLE